MPVKCHVPDRWPVEPGVYLLGNKYHPAAVLIPNDDDVGRELLRHAIDMGVAIVGFCKTTCIGLEKVICNILANPNIRWLIIAGHESPGYRSGKAIIMLHRYGVDPETRRILCGPREPCTDIPTGYIPNLPLELVERFRRQVTVVDLLVDGSEVRDDNVLELMCRIIYACVQEPWNRVTMKIKDREYMLFDPGAFDTEPVKYTITDSLELRYVNMLSENLTVIFADTIANAYQTLQKTLQLLRGEGKKRALNIVIHIANLHEKEERAQVKTIIGERQDITTRLIAEGSAKLDVNIGSTITTIHLALCNSTLHATVLLGDCINIETLLDYMFKIRDIMFSIVDTLSERGHSVNVGSLTLIICLCRV